MIYSYCAGNRNGNSYAKPLETIREINIYAGGGFRLACRIVGLAVTVVIAISNSC